MEVTLLGRNKMGLVDGSCPKDKYPGLEKSIWEMVNVVVLSWIMNYVEKGIFGSTILQHVLKMYGNIIMKGLKR